jgi:hypothetical protein
VAACHERVIVLFTWFLGLDVAVSSIGLGRIHLWLGGTLGAAAMGPFLWWRRPSLFQKARHAFDERGRTRVDGHASSTTSAAGG